MTNNEPSVKLPLPVASISLNGLCMSGLVYTEYGKSLDLRDGTNFYTEEQVRAAIALNAPGADAQGVVADVIWRIDNEAAQFIDKDGMIYLRYLRDLLANQRPAPAGVYAAKLNELVNKWRGIAKSHEIKADREGQSDDIRNWHQGADQAFGDCANELSTALAALAEGE